MVRGVRLCDIAKELDITPGEFSIQYMRMEQPEAVKDMLKATVDRIVKGE